MLINAVNEQIWNITVFLGLDLLQSVTELVAEKTLSSHVLQSCFKSEPEKQKVNMLIDTSILPFNLFFAVKFILKILCIRFDSSAIIIIILFAWLKLNHKLNPILRVNNRPIITSKIFQKLWSTKKHQQIAGMVNFQKVFYLLVYYILLWLIAVLRIWVI